MLQTKCSARIELIFFEYSDSKRFFVEPDIVKYSENSKPMYDLILGTEIMKELGIILEFKAKMRTFDEVILPMRNIIHLQGTSTLRALKLNHSLAMVPHSTQDTTKHVMRILDANYKSRSLVDCQR
jgi:hypothetical protein